MTETAPWWGVPVIAGSFLIIGGFLAFLYTYFNERRKSRLDDRRRFETEIIELYEKVDEVIDDFHEGVTVADGTADLKRAMGEYDRLYLQILTAERRMSVIAPQELAEILGRIRRAAARLSPDYTGSDLHPLRVLADEGEYFRRALRRHLRIRDERIPGRNPVVEAVESRLPGEWQHRLDQRRRRK